ncbi:hypothetical protein ACLOJK_025178 [Asimina triloba]
MSNTGIIRSLAPEMSSSTGEPSLTMDGKRKARKYLRVHCRSTRMVLHHPYQGRQPWLPAVRSDASLLLQRRPAAPPEPSNPPSSPRHRSTSICPQIRPPRPIRRTTTRCIADRPNPSHVGDSKNSIIEDSASSPATHRATPMQIPTPPSIQPEPAKPSPAAVAGELDGHDRPDQLRPIFQHRPASSTRTSRPISIRSQIRDDGQHPPSPSHPSRQQPHDPSHRRRPPPHDQHPFRLHSIQPTPTTAPTTTLADLHRPPQQPIATAI